MFKTIEQWADAYKDSGESATSFVAGQTECPLNAVELEIAAINPEAIEWLNEQLGEFMRPSAHYFDRKEWNDGLPGNRRCSTCWGWYARLSAPGYLDCTDWHGPYESEAQALVALWEVYGD